MANNQLVHPTTKDVENNAGEDEKARQSSQFVVTCSLESEKGGDLYPPSAGKGGDLYPPSAGRYLYSWPPENRKFCPRCLFITIFFLFALVVIITIACGILYLVIQPRIPKYSVDSVRIIHFSSKCADVGTDCPIDVRLKFWNPNKKIGICYLDNSRLAVSYLGTELWTGSLPVFYQGHKNTTLLDVELTRSGAQLTSAKISTLVDQLLRQAGVPMNLSADVPVKIKLGKLKLMKIKMHAQQDVVVDNFNVVNATARVTIEKSKATVKLWGLQIEI